MKIKKRHKARVFDWMFGSNKQQRTAFSISAPVSRPFIDPASRSSRAPAPLSSFVSLICGMKKQIIISLGDTHSKALRLVCT